MTNLFAESQSSGTVVWRLQEIVQFTEFGDSGMYLNHLPASGIKSGIAMK
jgi:hypothetical protein